MPGYGPDRSNGDVSSRAKPGIFYGVCSPEQVFYPLHSKALYRYNRLKVYSFTFEGF
jgi:hypothetical protein